MTRRRYDTAPQHAVAETRWTNPMPCGYCRKQAYPTRRAAKRALRALYPGDVGAAMNTYRCRSGGHSRHIGHRPRSVAGWPDWFDAAFGRPCAACPQEIRRGEPLALLGGLVLCLNCGDEAEQKALAS